MITLSVTQCGPAASVQDFGRFGYRRYGVSTAGAMDRRALALANALVGNPPDRAAVELPLTGATFEIKGGQIIVAAYGPGTTLAVAGRRIAARTSAQASDGDTIVVGPPTKGVYSYLAVAGGIGTKPLLGSRSRHRRSGIGGGVLAPGDCLPCVENGLGHPVFLAEGLEQEGDEQRDAENCWDGDKRGDRDERGDGEIRILSGPQSDHFTDHAWTKFLSQPYRIDPRSDRMGIRLEGPELESAAGHDIVSEGVVPGSLQVPGNGKPIALGQDCQTTGGYPKIATVISADLGRLAQLPTGHSVRFRLVSRTEAIEAARRSAHWCKALRTSMKPVAAVPDLLAHNLISGVTTGDEP